MDNGQAKESAVETTSDPICAIDGECGGFIRQKRDNKCRHQARFDVNLLKKALKTFVVGFNLCGAREGGSDFGQIDRLDLEQSDDDIGQTFDASQMPPKVEFEQINEYGSMVHSVISCSLSWHTKGCRDPSTIGDYTLFFKRLHFCPVQWLVVLDGLACDQWVVLREVLIQQRPQWHYQETAVFAWMPTITSVSRQAVFAGKPPVYYPGSIHKTDRENVLWP